MDLVIDTRGGLRCIYAEAIDLRALGRVSVERGSRVEADECGRWFADLSPVNGPKIGPFDYRSQALTAEHNWLREHWLTVTLSS